MRDELVLVKDIKKTILYVDKMLINFPRSEKILRDKINNTSFEILELVYFSNLLEIHERVVYQKKIISKTEVIELAPTKDTGPVIFFDNKDIRNNYYMGYYDTLLHFNKLDGCKYYFKKFHMYKFISRKVNNNLLNLVKLKFRTPDIKELIIKSIEDILEENKVDYYKVYSVLSIIKYIKKNNYKSKHKVVTDFVYSLKLL